MINKSSATKGSRGAKRLKLKKQTIRDLPVGRKGRDVKGAVKGTFGMSCGCPTDGCPETNPIPMPYPINRR